MDPELAAGFASLPPAASAGPPTAADLRAHFDNNLIGTFKTYQVPLVPPDNTYIIQDKAVPVDQGQINVRCLVPVVDDEKEKFPVLVYIHGGGWTIGSIDMDDYHLRILCVQLKLVIVNVDYRLAPEHLFPTAVDDCFAALKWTVSNASLLKVDLNKGFLVGGHSAGGNLCAVLTHLARDDPFFSEAPLTGQLLREPFIVHSAAYPEQFKAELRSMEKNKNIPLLTAELMNQFTEFYGAPPSDPRFSPLLYPSHRGLPRAFIQAAELDILRDDALVYDKALREAGVETRLVLFPGVTHGFHYEFPAIKAAARVRDSITEGLEWLLNRE